MTEEQIARAVYTGMTEMLWSAARDYTRPRHLVSDHGPQSDEWKREQEITFELMCDLVIHHIHERRQEEIDRREHEKSLHGPDPESPGNYLEDQAEREGR